jgi:hypothetical protein
MMQLVRRILEWFGFGESDGHLRAILPGIAIFSITLASDRSHKSCSVTKPFNLLLFAVRAAFTSYPLCLPCHVPVKIVATANCDYSFRQTASKQRDHCLHLHLGLVLIPSTPQLLIFFLLNPLHTIFHLLSTFLEKLSYQRAVRTIKLKSILISSTFSSTRQKSPSTSGTSSWPTTTHHGANDGTKPGPASARRPRHYVRLPPPI